VSSSSTQDRAYADAMIRMRWLRTTDPRAQDELRAQHLELVNQALAHHGELRSDIAEGRVRGSALRKRFEDVPALERDHFVEEVFGIAYPPLELEGAKAIPETVAYTPSGYEEIVHAFDQVKLGPSDHVFDIGSGLGKAPLLATLLYGARSSGLELDRTLHDHAVLAARALEVDLNLRCGDALTDIDTHDDDANVVFMYIPFTGSILADVMSRLMQKRRSFLICAALDLRAYPDLEIAGPAMSWLHVYKWGTASTTMSASSVVAAEST